MTEGNDEGERWTYETLNEKANSLARALRAKGVGRDTVVGLMTEGAPEMVAAMLAILKAGGAYLPIDPELPGERVNFMLQDSGVSLLLTNTGTPVPEPGASSFPEVMDIGLTEWCEGETGNLDLPVQGDDLLYVIYTSGSTGRPKGVMLEHGNLVNLMLFQYEGTCINFSRVLQFTTISFDVSFQEIFSTLLRGGELYLIDKELRGNIPALFDVIRRHDVTTLFFRPLI